MQDLIKSLHPLERKLLPFLEKKMGFRELVNKSKLKEIEVLRALNWLSVKNVLNVSEEVKEMIILDKHGKNAIENRLPEKRVVDVLTEELTLEQIKEKLSLTDNEINIALGILKRNKAITIINQKITLTPAGKKLQKKDLLPEEEFLRKLPMGKVKLTKEDEQIFDELKKRSQIKVDIQKLRSIELTPLGEKLVKAKMPEEILETLTPEMIKIGSWKGKEFRTFDIKSKTPRLVGGKFHIIRQSIDHVKRIWLDLGFKEIKGSLVQTSFWNFDALFTAQDHPVREIHDTFFIKSPKLGDLPKDEKLVSRVKQVHENGWTTGSTGWNYKWNKEEARKLVLRTHTTCLSAKAISELKKSDLPVKLFSIGKVFRNEALDWSHLFEFYQVEGIIVDKNANFKHLLGYLKEYYKRLGYDKIKFKPSYFPYTEMSVEPMVYDKERNVWLELGGAGMLRPEVVKPLFGEDMTVLAFGQGFERGIKDYYKIGDLRDIYNNDLKLLREGKILL